MAELYGKATGCCAGKGGSMHLGDPASGMLPAIAIVGGGNSVVTGHRAGVQAAAHRSGRGLLLRRRGDERGRVPRGPELRGGAGLPIVFVCENNLYGASTPFSQVSPVADVAERAAAYGMPGADRRRHGRAGRSRGSGRGDRAARAGEGPTLLECKTYRFVGHSRSDARGYRSRATRRPSGRRATRSRLRRCCSPQRRRRRR